MTNQEAQLQTITEQVIFLLGEVTQLKQRITDQEVVIVEQNKIIAQQKQEIDLLKSKLDKALVTGTVKTVDKDIDKNNTLNSEIFWRKKSITINTLVFSLGILITLFFFGSPKEVQSRIIINPPGYNDQFGAIIMPQGSTFSDAPQANDAKFGVVASGNPTLSLSTLPLFDTGVFGAGGGYGVYATSFSSQGFGLYSLNTATTGLGNSYAIYGRSVKGTGIGGESSGTGYGIYGLANTSAGVYGASNTGSGVLASSLNGAPLSILAGATPTAGSRTMGDIYVDSAGRIYIWAKSNDLLTSNWRQLQFAP